MRLNVLRTVLLRLQLFAQPAHHDVHRARVQLGFMTAQLVQDVVPAEDFARLARQQVQQVELRAGQLHHHAVALGFFTPLIMLMTNLAAPAEPWTLVRDRAVDVVIGVAVGVAVWGIVRLYTR